MTHVHESATASMDLFAVDRQVRPGINLKMGRPGKDLWRELVLAILKQELGCDYDRWQELAHRHIRFAVNT